MINKEATGVGRTQYSLIELLSRKKNIQISIYLYFRKSLLSTSSYIKFYGLLKNGFYRSLIGLPMATFRIKPDIVHVNFFAPIIKRALIVNHIHDLAFKKYPETFPLKTRFLYKTLFKRSLLISDAIVCPSSTIKKEIIKTYKINPSKVFIVNGACDSAFKKIKETKEIHKALSSKYNIKKEYFLVVGDITKRKSPIQIVEAFLQVLKKLPDAQLIFIGKNYMEDILTRKYHSLMNENKVRFLGYLNDKELNTFYNCATALVFFSLDEGFGLPLVEAMNCSTPIICRDIPIFREIAAGSALYAKDVNELSKRMFLLFGNLTVKKKYSLLSYKRRENFSWEKSTTQLLNAYQYVYNEKFNTPKF